MKPVHRMSALLDFFFEVHHFHLVVVDVSEIFDHTVFFLLKKQKKRVIFCQPNFSKPKKSFRSVNRKFLKNQLI